MFDHRNKKILLVLGTLSLVVVSSVLAVVASCSPETKTITMKGSLNSGAETTTEMKITIAAIKIYEADESITPDSGDKTALITALNATSFTGLVVADVPNYKITYTETPGSETITLTPNKWFKFSTNTSLVSTVNNMVVMPGAINSGGATTTEIKTTIKAIADYEVILKPTDSDKDTLIAALIATSFTGLVVADVPNFVISYDDTIGSETITLTANTGFKFGTGTPLVSIIIISGVNTAPIEDYHMIYLQTQISDYNQKPSPTDEDKRRIVSQLLLQQFSGLSDEDFIDNRFSFANVGNTVVVTAKIGFIFATGTTLISTIKI